jgi:hypothetical protein
VPAADLLPVIEDIRAEGADSLRQIARGLTSRGYARRWDGNHREESARRV